MSFTAEQKSQLAKLLATENLSVQHAKIRTAKFDPANRVLYLPIWQNMTGAIYDLLVGHEVGHALYTPAEGWHDAVTGPDKQKNYKNFLNVVEDARIEKKVQRKYPGLKTPFNRAYAELIARDFFGTKGLDINELSFIDRLNIFSKSQWSNMAIKFSAKEKMMVDQVRAAETWEDVLKITDAVFQYSKEEQKEMMLQQFEQMMAQSAEEGEDEYEDDYDTDYDSDADGDGDADGDSGDGENGEGNSDAQMKSDADANGEEEDGDSKESQFNRFKESQESWEDQFSPDCQTDKEFRRNEDNLLDENCKEVIYVTLPKPNLNYIITPVKRVMQLQDEQVSEYIREKWLSPTLANELYQQFKNRNERYIGLLAKEFEMRKAARAYNKSKVSDTGDIDINKLATYKFDDNIFRKMMVIPKGKSHGLVLLLDKSGSMSRNMSGSIEQILILAMFCRKVNIPFVMYGFGDANGVKVIDEGGHEKYSKNRQECFSQEENELYMHSTYLREYLNSKMSNVEFTKAVKHLLLIKESFETANGRYYSKGKCPRFATEELSSTPLTESLVAVAEIMKDFKKKNNLDITNLVIVHDGDADAINGYVKMRNDYHGKPFKGSAYFEKNKANYYLQDNKNKYSKQLNPANYGDLNEVVLDWFTKVTDAKVFGFFLCDTYRGAARYALENRFYVDDVALGEIRHKNWYQYKELLTKKQKELRSEKFLESKSPGYKSFFLIAGGSDLSAEDEGIEIEGKATTRKLISAFAKYNKKKAVNRVLVSKFIQGIAA